MAWQVSTFLGSCQVLPESFQVCQHLLALRVLRFALLSQRVPVAAELASLCVPGRPRLLLQRLGASAHWGQLHGLAQGNSAL